MKSKLIKEIRGYFIIILLCSGFFYWGDHSIDSTIKKVQNNLYSKEKYYEPVKGYRIPIYTPENSKELPSDFEPDDTWITGPTTIKTGKDYQPTFINGKIYMKAVEDLTDDEKEMVEDEN